MRDRVISFSLVVVIGMAAAVTAEDRLAVFENFGRKGCANCNAAAEVVTVLQEELNGRAVLLEYDYDLFLHGRQDRFWATGVQANYLPLMMVGSGYRTSSGVVDFDRVYRGMIDDELERAPRASVTAYWRRVGSSLRAYVDVTNLGPTDLEVSRDAGIWVIGYENAPIGNTQTWVQSTSVRFLSYDLAPGEGITAVIDTPPVDDLTWDRMAGLVLVEDRPHGSAAYDMLQAVEALPVAVTATPDDIALSRRRPEAEVVVTGPHVLTWSAASDVSWIEVTPGTGAVPGTLTVTLRPELRPAAESEGTVTLTAIGDGMELSTTLRVAMGAQVRRASGRIRPDGVH